jgi:hypothetical protein
MKPATHDDLRQGIRIRCIYLGISDRTGKTGTVMRMRNNNLFGGIIINWDDDNSIWTSWTSPGSFEVFVD